MPGNARTPLGAPRVSAATGFFRKAGFFHDRRARFKGRLFMAGGLASERRAFSRSFFTLGVPEKVFLAEAAFPASVVHPPTSPCMR